MSTYDPSNPGVFWVNIKFWDFSPKLNQFVVNANKVLYLSSVQTPVIFDSFLSNLLSENTNAVARIKKTNVYLGYHNCDEFIEAVINQLHWTRWIINSMSVACPKQRWQT